jgi:hypothetical protein
VQKFITKKNTDIDNFHKLINGNELGFPLGSICFMLHLSVGQSTIPLLQLGILGGSFTTHNCAQKPPIRQNQTSPIRQKRNQLFSWQIKFNGY